MLSSPVTLRSRRLGAEIAHLGAAGQGHLAAGHRALHLAKRDHKTTHETTGKCWVFGWKNCGRIWN